MRLNILCLFLSKFIKKTISILALFMLLGNNNLKAHGGGGAGILFLMGIGAGVVASPILSYAPHLFKDDDTYYSYDITLASTIVSTTTIPFIVGGITNNEGLMFGSTFVAPIVGTYLGYNYSKTKNNNIASIRKKEGESFMDTDTFRLSVLIVSFVLASDILK